MCGVAAAGIGISLASMYLNEQQRKENERAKAMGYESQAEASDYNAAVEENLAEEVERKGEGEVSEFKKDVKRHVGAQRASFGSSGVDVNTGVALDVVAASEFQGAQDAMVLRENFEIEAQAHRDSAEAFRQNAAYSRQAAGQSRRNARRTIWESFSNSLF